MKTSNKMRVSVKFPVTVTGLFCAATHCCENQEPLTKSNVFKKYRDLCHDYGFPYVGIDIYDDPTWYPYMAHAQRCLDWMQKHWEFDSSEIDSHIKRGC